MKTAIIFGKEFTIRNSDHQKLIKKFDTSRFKYDSYGYNSNIRCPLCMRYGRNCDGCKRCPCKSVSNSCFTIIKKIALPRGGKQYYHESAAGYSIKKGKKQLDRIHKFLLEKFK